MRHLAIFVTVATLAFCASGCDGEPGLVEAVFEHPAGGPGLSGFCPNVLASANGVPSPGTPPPYIYHSCYNADGVPSAKQGTPCKVCGDYQDFYPVLTEPGDVPCFQLVSLSAGLTNFLPADAVVLCVPPAESHHLGDCRSADWGCI